MLKKFTVQIALAAATLAPGWALAVGDHAGDIAVSALNGKLMVGGAHFESHGLTGFNIYEADFGDLAGGLWTTKNPGFQTQGGSVLTPGALISFSGLGSLKFWNGLSWGAAASDLGVTVADALQEAPTVWRASGVTAGETQYVSQVAGDGSIHDHLKMSVTPNAPVGAYLIELQLNSASYQSSDPFYIVFNRGLSAEAFEGSVEVLTAVPEPGAYALMLAGLCAVGWVARRRGANVH